MLFSIVVSNNSKQHQKAKTRNEEYIFDVKPYTVYIVFAFGLSAKLMPKALELLFPHPPKDPG
jgi:hypothetical protein